MKKLRLLFSLCLAFLFSLGTVWAQSENAFPRLYHAVDRITEIESGTKILLTSTGMTGGTIYHEPEADFMHLEVTPQDTTSFSSTLIRDNAFFIIEEVGTHENEKTQETHKTYRLKHEASGLYLKRIKDESNFAWTNNPAEAFVFTALHPAGYTPGTTVSGSDNTLLEPQVDNPRANIGRGGTTISFEGYEHGWIMCDISETLGDDNSYLYYYMCGYENQYKGYFSTYRDTNLWAYMTAEPYAENEYFEALESMVWNELFPSGFSPEDYAIGTTPGMYPDKTLVDKLAEAWAEFEAFEMSEATNATYESCAAVYQKLYDAKEALEASVVTFEDGQYYIIVGKRMNSGNYADAEKVRITRQYAADGIPAELTFNDAKYVWQLHKAENGKGFYIQNYVTKTYASYNSSASGTVPMTEEPVTAYYINANTTNASHKGHFNIIPTTNTNTAWNTHNTAADDVGYYGFIADDEGDQFRFYSVDEEVVKGFDAQLAQEALNNELKPLFIAASSSYNKERIYTSDETANDGVFTSPADGKVLSAEQLTSNAVEPNEGSLAYLVDGNIETYFHSTWSSVVDNGNLHHLDIDLGEELQTIVFKYARRYWANENLSPTKVNIYATNDTTAATGKWDYKGVYTLKHNVATHYSKHNPLGDLTGEVVIEDSIVKNAGGMTGFDLGAPYRHVRMEVVSTMSVDTKGILSSANNKNGVPYFTLAEFRVYGGKFDEQASLSFTSVSEPVRTALANNLAIAMKAHNEGKATREIIDNLKKAYDDFLKEFADADEVTAALSEVKDQLKPYVTAGMISEEPEIGMFSATAKAEADATIQAVEAEMAEAKENGTLVTLEEIKAKIARLETAVENFKKTLVYPEVGKIYALRGGLAKKNTYEHRDSMVLNSLIYATGNASTAGLKYIQDSLHTIDPSENLNYLWKVESCENGQISLRNLATGYYLDTINNRNGASLRNAEAQAFINLQTAMSPRGFYFIVGKSGEDNLYLNYSGNNFTSVLTWNAVGANDNSVVKFEEVDAFTPEEEIETLFATWPTVSDGYQIMTLPFGVYYVEEENAKAYTMLGEKAAEGEGNPTLELKAINEGEIIAAGTPFVLYTGEEQTNYKMNLDMYDPYNIPYVFEVNHKDGEVITGTVRDMELGLDVFGKGILRNGSVVYIKSTSSSNRNIPGNSGYINYVETTETGDAFIELTGGSLTTGIAGGVIVDNNAKVNVYTISGVQVRKAVKAADATKGLPAGIYVVGGRKVIVK